MAMIESLTPEQEAQISIYRDASMAVGLTTLPCDKEVATKAIMDLYDFVGIAKPTNVLFVESPMAAQVAITLLKQDYPKYSKLLMERTGTILGEWGDVKPTEYVETHGYGYGSAECYWIFYYKYFKEVVGLKYEEKADRGLEIMERLARSSYWHYTFADIAILCDRPCQIEMENNVINNEEGPAVAFSDGIKIYAIGGHVVPERVVMAPETLTVAEIEKEDNAETKRIMIDRFGVSKYLMETGAKIIDVDALNLEGSSPRTLMEDNQGNRWLIGTDGSTGRVYHMAVPQEANTCTEAHSMISGFDESNIVAEC